MEITYEPGREQPVAAKPAENAAGRARRGPPAFLHGASRALIRLVNLYAPGHDLLQV